LVKLHGNRNIVSNLECGLQDFGTWRN